MGAVSKDLHIDKLLSEFAMGYRPVGFIADMIMPQVNVQKQSDLYPVFDRGDRLRQQDTKRAPGTRAKRVVENVGSATYFANNYALSAAVLLEDKVNADPIMSSEIVEGRTRLVLDHLLLDWEIRVAGLVTNTSNVGSSSGVSSAWNGAGDPIGDLNAAIDNVRYSNGRKPNLMVIGPKAMDSLRRDTTVRNIINGTNNGGGYPNANDIAQLFQIDKVLIGDAFQNTAEEGQGEALSAIWDDKVLVAYVPPSPSFDEPSFGYSLRWAAPGLPNMQVERHPYDSRTKSEDVEAGYYQEEKLTGPSYGFLLDAVNSST